MKELRFGIEIKVALERTDVQWLEEELLKLRERVFLGVFKRILVEIEKEAVEKLRRCEGCGGLMVKNGHESKTIKSLLGKVRVERFRLRCKGCGKEVYPLDEAIGLKGRDSVTLGVKEGALWAAVEVSYEKAHEFLRKFTGLEVSRKKIHQMAIEEGRRIQELEEEKRRLVFERGGDIEDEGLRDPEVLYIQVDGTGINERRGGSWMECKVGACFSERVKVSKDRYWLKDKRTFASIEGAESFGEKLFLECMKAGVLRAKRVFLIGDGATWIRRLKEDYFPGAVGVLDLWHLVEELKWAFGEERMGLVEEFKSLALRGEGFEIVRRLRGELEKCESLEEREKVSQVIKYVKGNMDWIENISRVGIYGSGAIEKTVDITVTRRFKRRGMSWYRGNANALLRLRVLKLNGEWDAYWEGRKNEFVRHAA